MVAALAELGLPSFRLRARGTVPSAVSPFDKSLGVGAARPPSARSNEMATAGEAQRIPSNEAGEEPVIYWDTRICEYRVGLGAAKKRSIVHTRPHKHVTEVAFPSSASKVNLKRTVVQLY